MFSITRTLISLAILMASALASVAQTESLGRPFSEKLLIEPNIHVETPSLFRPWLGGDIPLGAYDPVAFKRLRLGTISLTANVHAHIDAVENTVHFPSYFELVDVRTGSTLGIFPVFSIEDAEWYFSGNAAVYLNQRHLSLCGPRYTRKLVVTAKSVAEVPQPILYIGLETEVLETVPLYESPASKTVVATVLPNTKVTVVGLHYGSSRDATPPLLVKTPFGLTGWHRRDGTAGNGSLLIYQCN